MTNPDLLTLDAVKAAAERIKPYVNETPIVSMVPTGIALKAESLHPIGAFKIRGAFNAILSLSEADRRRGVVAHSSGNHAQGVAYAARALGIPSVIVMPTNVSPVKLAATKALGAEVHLVPASERATKFESLSRERGLIQVPPFDSLAIMAGTGTIGLEILKQRPDVKVVLAPVSGGGLLGGISAAVAQAAPGVQVIGVEPELANDAAMSFREGHIVSLSAEETARTIADGLRVQQLGRFPFANIRAYTREIVTVSEDEIKAAMKKIAVEARLIAEPSGAVALAGALKLGLDPKTSVAVLSGGNVELGFYASVLAN